MNDTKRSPRSMPPGCRASTAPSPRAPAALAAVLVLVLAWAGNGCDRPAPTEPTEATRAPATAPPKEEGAMAFELRSDAFSNGARIPARHTCDGEDRSPALRWNAPPPDTAAFALIVNDPDAPVGDWVHWVLYDLPPETRALPQGIPPTGVLGSGAKQGLNDFKRLGYGGPCPPRGDGPHRYVFTLYALDAPLGLKAGLTRADVLAAMRGHILETATLTGTYERN